MPASGLSGWSPQFHIFFSSRSSVFLFIFLRTKALIVLFVEFSNDDHFRYFFSRSLFIFSIYTSVHDSFPISFAFFLVFFQSFSGVRLDSSIGKIWMCNRKSRWDKLIATNEIIDWNDRDWKKRKNFPYFLNLNDFHEYNNLNLIKPLINN